MRWPREYGTPGVVAYPCQVCVSGEERHVSTPTKPADFAGGLRRGEMAADQFSIISNALARDPNISFRAKGVFLALLNHDADQAVAEDSLASAGAGGRKAVRAALAELHEAGYVRRGEHRSRYPSGTTNAAGKDISGALGPCGWTVAGEPPSSRPAAVSTASGSKARVYLIGAGRGQPVKIGRTVDVPRRCAQLQATSPVPLRVLWSTPGTPDLETHLHARFRAKRLHGEWFDFGADDPIRPVRAAARLFTTSKRRGVSQ